MEQQDGGPAGEVTLPAYGLVARADAGMSGFLLEMTAVLESFGISRAEAVARMNRSWGRSEFEPYPDLMCHETPEHWAYGMYYDDGSSATVPYWDPDADRSAWTVVPPPPDGDPAWTLPREE
ncbi:hypothetical protein [Kitasatospora phosalacinea]|uniref:hypothetical protein n=1 Tax=Kitasatospora phosalacinea TaxID=2065 RepID=UPI002552AABE|nr:hypothetical protein [Kitasatospora phosalacinea]